MCGVVVEYGRLVLESIRESDKNDVGLEQNMRARAECRVDVEVEEEGVGEIEAND